MANKTMHHAVIGPDTFELVDQSARADVDQLKNALTAVEIVDTASGAIASFADGSDSLPVKGLKVQMEPIQAGSGDPSPDNVRPISGRDSVTVTRTRTGANIWDEEWEQGYFNSLGQESQSTTAIRSVNYISCKPSTAYYFKFGTSTNAVLFALWYDANKTFILRTGVGNQAITTPSNAYYMKICTNQDYGGTYANDISINYPPTDHNYHAYQGQSIEIQLGQTVYGGTLDVTNGVLTVTHANITSYSGETLPGRWISSMDVYTAGGTPTTGAQVVYELAQPVTVQLTAQQLTTLLGQNNVWSDADSVSVDYVADTKLYIEQLTEPDADMVADMNITSGKYFMVGNSLYLATANIANGANIVVGVNCTRTSLAEALNAINS